jgi:hypothetical protein
MTHCYILQWRVYQSREHLCEFKAKFETILIGL